MLPLKGSEMGKASRRMRAAQAQHSNRGPMTRFNKGLKASKSKASRPKRIETSQHAQKISAIGTVSLFEHLLQFRDIVL